MAVSLLAWKIIKILPNISHFLLLLLSSSFFFFFLVLLFLDGRSRFYMRENKKSGEKNLSTDRSSKYTTDIKLYLISVSFFSKSLFPFSFLISHISVSTITQNSLYFLFGYISQLHFLLLNSKF